MNKKDVITATVVSGMVMGFIYGALKTMWNYKLKSNSTSDGNKTTV